MHVELTEKEMLSCGLPMYVCSLHEKECPCRLCSIAHVTVTWGCALQVTVQFLLLSAAALQSSGPLGSHALLVSCPPEHQSRKER